MKVSIRLTAVAGAIAFAAFAQTSSAQESALEEIVVTARKVEENLMEAPLAISAMSAATLEKMNLTEMGEIASFTPGFHYVKQVGGGSGRNDRSASSLVFRGLYLGTLNREQQAGGLVFLDGSPLLGGQAPAMVDMERVEVLKGPQSAYFGRSVLSGAINYVSRNLNDEEFQGRLTASAASFDSSLVQVALEGPIMDGLAVRVSASRDEKGGQYKNYANPDIELGGELTESFVVQVQFRPTDRLSAKLFFQQMEHDDGPPAQAALKGSTGDFNCDLGGRMFGYYCGELPDTGDLPASHISGHYTLDQQARAVLVDAVDQATIFDPSFRPKPGLGREAENASLRIDYDTESGYTFSALTAYHTDKDMTIIDLNFRDRRNVPNPLSFVIPGAPQFNRWQLAVQSRFRDWSQELRVSSPQDRRLRWTLGGSYLDSYSPGGSVYGLSVFGSLFAAGITKAETTTPAIFGGLQYDINEKLTLSVDARYQRDELLRQLLINSTGNPPEPPGGEPLEAEFTSFAPRVSLDYQYSEGSMVYVLFSRGYRPGGFNAILQGSPQQVLDQFAQFGASVAYEEERLDNFEAGMKSTWLGGRLQTRLAVYFDPYRNGQNQITIPFTNPDGTLNLASVFVNTGEADLQGFEFEFDAAPTENLTLSGSLGLADSEVKNFVCGDGVNVRGDNNCDGSRLPSASKWTWTLSADYEAALTDNYNWFARVDYAHLGKYFVDYTNEAWVAPQDIFNLRLGLRSDALTLEAFGTNLFEEDSPPSAVIGNDLFTVARSNEIRYSLARKRTFGVRAVYNF
ncbi:MAG: TonB-dependent receptor [Gammaproteobacteria bacterium]|nr:TonB-dependent receptor [Gammaproteobacteria bacterium]